MRAPEIGVIKDFEIYNDQIVQSSLKTIMLLQTLPNV